MNEYAKKYLNRLKIIGIVYFFVGILPIIIAIITNSIYIAYGIPAIILAIWGYKKIKKWKAELHQTK